MHSECPAGLVIIFFLKIDFVDFGEIVGLSHVTVRRIEQGYDCLSDRSKAKVEAFIGKEETAEATHSVPEETRNAPRVPFDTQKVVAPNSLAQPEKRLTRQNLLRVAWFLEGYNARDNCNALRNKIVLLHAMADEIGEDRGA